MPDFGYGGEILKIDLSAGKTDKLPTADYSDKYIGGRGIAARLYWEMVPPHIKASDPDNALICASGPVAGFPGFAGCRWVTCGKSALREPESFSYSNLGGSWGVRLKYAGYDGIVVQGKSERPSYLVIHDGKVEIKDASHLWGKTTYETIDLLKAELGKGVSVLTIGPAAENAVVFATILAEQGASGSGGIGGTMGSKNLKAIVVAGDKRPLAADPATLSQLADRVRRMRDDKGAASPWVMPGFTKPQACYGCGLGCERQSYHGEDGRSYKSLCQATIVYAQPNMSRERAVQLLATRLCDAYGLDTAVMQGLIDLLGACYRQGLLQEKETGLPLAKFGSAEFIQALSRSIAFREGFGATLARGTIATAAAIGGEAQKMLHEFVATSGSETKDYDPRLFITSGLLYATEPRRPIQQLHEQSWPVRLWTSWQRGAEGAYFSTADFREAAVRFWGGELAADFSTYAGKALAAKKIQDRTCAKESLVLCDFKWPKIWGNFENGHVGDPTLESQIYTAITGKQMDETTLNRAGERIFNLQRVIQLRQGRAGRQDDTLLDYLFEVPLRKGELFVSRDCLLPGRDGEVISREGKTVDREAFEKLKDEYYALRGWDTASGLPIKEKLEVLGLGDVAADLQRRGLLK
ncbi:MAG: aldehyde ferredoxin oxidoreductase N-terminal domain-containing protein [Dehalococcoidales bacterium]